MSSELALGGSESKGGGAGRGETRRVTLARQRGAEGSSQMLALCVVQEGGPLGEETPGGGE